MTESPDSTPSSGIEPWLRELLRCPKCHAELSDTADAAGAPQLACTSATSADPPSEATSTERGRSSSAIVRTPASSLRTTASRTCAPALARASSTRARSARVSAAASSSSCSSTGRPWWPRFWRCWPVAAHRCR